MEANVDNWGTKTLDFKALEHCGRFLIDLFQPKWRAIRKIASVLKFDGVKITKYLTG